jgi:hypothetical protein
MAKSLPKDAEAGGGLMVAVILHDPATSVCSSWYRSQ